MTASSMHDWSGAEGQRLLEAGEYIALVEGHRGVIIRRSQAKVPRGDSIDVMREVDVRQHLASEPFTIDTALDV